MLNSAVFTLASALLGAVLIPTVAFFSSLALFYVFDAQCGTPSDSGGCEMRAGVIGFVAVIPGLLSGIAAGKYFTRPHRRSSTFPRRQSLHREAVSPANEDEPAVSLGGLPNATIESVRRWASGTSEIQRIWLVGARARGSFRHDCRVDFAVETYGWDSPDPRDRLQAYGNWLSNGAGWRTALAGMIPFSLKVWALSIDGEDGALRSVPSDGQVIYQRDSLA